MSMVGFETAEKVNRKIWGWCSAFLLCLKSRQRGPFGTQSRIKLLLTASCPQVYPQKMWTEFTKRESAISVTSKSMITSKASAKFRDSRLTCSSPFDFKSGGLIQPFREVILTFHSRANFCASATCFALISSSASRSRHFLASS